MKKLLLTLFCVALVACSVPRSVKEGGPVSGQQVSPAGKVLVLSINDGQEQGQSVATGSGRGMASALRKVLVERQISMTTSESLELSAGYDEATASGYDYVLKGTITLWEDNATAWSGNGDKLTLDVEMYDVKTKQLVAASSHSRVATGATFVSGTPHRFMDEVAEGALAQIYGWPASVQ